MSARRHGGAGFTVSEGVPKLVVVTGMSGAGKTTALHALEDSGFLAVDNVPPNLWVALLDRVTLAGVPALAVAIDVRAGVFLQEAPAAIDALQAHGYVPRVLYLDAPTDTLIRRFSFTRRTHAMQRGVLSEDLERERTLLAPLRDRADVVIDTRTLTAKELRQRVQRLSGEERFELRIVSFGYKRGLPTDADTVLDVRGMRNPYYDDALRPLPGTDPRVQRHVFAEGGADRYTRLRDMARDLAEAARTTGRGGYAVAIGCTGGQHRSVAVTERLAHDLADAFDVQTTHRDLAAALAEHRPSKHDAERVSSDLGGPASELDT